MGIEVFETQIIEGEDLRLNLAWTEKDSGNPIDLTGSTIKLEADIEGFDQDLTILDAANGVFELHLDKSKTIGFTGDKELRFVKFLVKHTEASGDVRYIFKIEVAVYADHD